MSFDFSHAELVGHLFTCPGRFRAPALPLWDCLLLIFKGERKEELRGDRGTIARWELGSKPRAWPSDGSECRNRPHRAAGTRARKASHGRRWRFGVSRRARSASVLPTRSEVFTQTGHSWGQSPMRVKFFERHVDSGTEGNESLPHFQDRINAWLRKARKKPHYRIVDQTVGMGSLDDIPSNIVVSIWYDKVPPKE